MTEYLEDGHATLYTFSNAPTIKLKEIEVTPPGVDGGGPIEQTTMRNEVWHTDAPKSLKRLTMGKFTAAYDPAVLDEIVANINVNQLITVTYPDDDTIDFWGFINKWVPNPHKIGERPTADVEIHPTNRDDNGDETAPEHTAAP